MEENLACEMLSMVPGMGCPYEPGIEKLMWRRDAPKGLGTLRKQESPRREFPNHCHPSLQLWPPSCWAESLAKAAGHLLTWPAVPMAEAPAGGPASSAANASTGSRAEQGDKAAPGETTVSLSDSTVLQAGTGDRVGAAGAELAHS